MWTADSKKGRHARMNARRQAGRHAHKHTHRHTKHLCSATQEALTSAKQLDYCAQTLPVGSEVGQTQQDNGGPQTSGRRVHPLISLVNHKPRESSSPGGVSSPS